MNIDAIRNGIVIDHITAGKAMQVYNMLNLDKLDCQVAIIRNAASTRTGTKDIIKIASDKDLDLGVLSFVCPTATINVIRDGRVLEKRNVELPEKSLTFLNAKTRAALPPPNRKFITFLCLRMRKRRVSLHVLRHESFQLTVNHRKFEPC